MIVWEIRRGKRPFDELCSRLPSHLDRPMGGFDAGSLPPCPPGNFYKDTNVSTDIEQSPAGRRTNEAMHWQQVFSKCYDASLTLLNIQRIFNFYIIVENHAAVVARVGVYQTTLPAFHNSVVSAVSGGCTSEGGVIPPLV